MPATTGVDFVLEVENPASPGTYRQLGGQRGTGLNRGVADADLTSKDSNGWDENAPTNRNWMMRADILVIEDDPAYLDLETAWLNNTRANVQITTPAGNVWRGLATVVDLSIDGPHDDAMSGTVELKGSGAISKNP